MVIGFFGKGGSGKTTLSTRFIRYLEAQGTNVLAIDADHNMDLAFNLGAPSQLPYLGEALPAIKEECDIPLDTHYSQAVLRAEESRFFLQPLDAFTDRFSVPITKRLRLMVCGPHTDQVLYGDACSHILSTPLKVYLPLLSVGENEVVVLDLTAGTDAAGSGVATGLDMACIVAEATPHGLKAARQIADMLGFYNVPYAFLLNKIQNIIQDTEEAKRILQTEASYLFMANSQYLSPHASTSTLDERTFENMRTSVQTHLDANATKRLSRSKEKFLRNSVYKASH